MTISFIFSQWHTGSKLLCSLLNSHPDVCVWHEALQPIKGKITDYEAVAEHMLKESGKTIAVLHGHINWIHPDVLAVDAPKIGLDREDFFMGAIKQIMLDYTRPHNQFTLDPYYVKKAIEVRKKNNKIIRDNVDLLLSFEDLTRSGEVTELNNTCTRRALKLIGADRQTLKAGVYPQKAMLPSNLDEIHNAVYI